MNKIIYRTRLILFVASVGNILGTLVALISPAFFNAQLFRFPPSPSATFPYLALYHYCFWGVGLIMGIAYWMSALNPVKNRIVLFIGSLGKLLLIAFLLMLYLQGHGGWLMLAGVLWDGPLGLLMLLLYFRLGNSAEEKKQEVFLK